MTSQRSTPQFLTLILLSVLLAWLWFFSIGHNALVRPDEGRYAEIPREMLVSGNWVTPRLDGLKYFEKPPLQYWATATAYAVFGEHEWTARLWAALTGYLGILVAAFTGERLFGRRAGLMAGLVLASSFLYFAIGHIAILDMGVTFFMALSLFALLLGQTASTLSAQRNWMLVCWLGMALSMLSKGLIGIAIPGAVLILYSLLARDIAIWKRLHFLPGLILFAVVTVPWFVLVSRANPEFLWFFFIHEHFLRYLTPEAGRMHPWYTFIPVVLLGILPWLGTLPDTLRGAWPATPTRGFSAEKMLTVWTVFIFVFFSISHSKLVPYILPIFPSLALLIGKQMAVIDGKRLSWQMLVIVPFAALLFLMAPYITRSASAEVPVQLFQHFSSWLQKAALAWLAGGLIAFWFARREKILSATVAMALGGIIMGQLVYLGYDQFSPASSARSLAIKIRPWLKPGAPFYSVAMYEQTLPPYLHQTVILVAHPDEMAFGIQQEPSRWVPTVAAFERLWPLQPYALAIMSPAEYVLLQQHGLAMQVIARDTRRVVVVTPQKPSTEKAIQ